MLYYAAILTILRASFIIQIEKSSKCVEYNATAAVACFLIAAVAIYSPYFDFLGDAASGWQRESK